MSKMIWRLKNSNRLISVFNYIISFKFGLDGADMDMYVKELELDLHEPEVGIFSSNNPRLEVIEFASDDGVKNTTKFIKKFFKRAF